MEEKGHLLLNNLLRLEVNKKVSLGLKNLKECTRLSDLQIL